MKLNAFIPLSRKTLGAIRGGDQNTSGQPGSTPSIRVRGTSSTNGDTEPM